MIRFSLVGGVLLRGEFHENGRLGGDGISLDELEEAARKLRLENVPPWRCPACGSGFYLLNLRPEEVGEGDCPDCALRRGESEAMTPAQRRRAAARLEAHPELRTLCLDLLRAARRFVEERGEVPRRDAVGAISSRSFRELAEAAEAYGLAEREAQRRKV